VRTATRRARRLGGLLLLAATVWWAFLRRRASAVTWAEPPATVPPEPVSPATVSPATVPPEPVPPGPVPPGPGAPGVLPDDVIATDAGLTQLPSEEAVDGPGTVDEARVAELLAESPGTDVLVVDETAYEEALADAAPEPGSPTPDLPELGPAADGPTDEPTETDLVAPGVDEPTTTIRTGAGADEEETGTRIPMPTLSEAPTMEIPAVSDDLRAVRGIGPSMERKLHGLGIISFRQLAMLDGVELERVRAELSDFRSRIEREDWVGQARALHREKYGRDPS
jgi:predicted flap endonuclease-1-like 5' DNA nuclease